MDTMTSAPAGLWTADPATTRVGFSARHLLGPAVPGTIAVTCATIEVGADGRARRLHASLDPASIDTGHPRRDRDLRGRRFLAVDTYPRLEVVADQITATADGWSAEATVCARGCEAPLRLDATLADATTTELHVTASARLDLRTVGIRVPGFLVRRRVDLWVTARLTRPA